MPFDWQQIVAICVAALAGGYLLRRAWRLSRGASGGCGACPSCATDTSADGKPLVTIRPTSEASSRDRHERPTAASRAD